MIAQRLRSGNPLILAQLMKKQLIEVFELALLAAALGEIGPEHGGKLAFIQDINELQLLQAVQHLRRRHPQAGDTCGFNKF